MSLLDIVKKGSTDRSVTIKIIDSGDGTPETGVAYNTSGIDLWYRREGAALQSITEADLAALTTAHTDGGVKHIGNGEYRLDLPDAAFASGANHVDIGGTVTGMIVIGGRVRLVDYDPEDAVRMGQTALPNANAASSGGLPTVGSGSGQITLSSGGVTVGTNNDKTGYGLVDGAITAAKIASDAITSAKIQDAALTAAKFASGAFDAVWTVSARTLTSISGLGIALASKLTKYVQLILRSDSAIQTDNSTEITEINADGGSGAGSFVGTTDSQQAIRDRGDAAWTGGGGGGGPTAEEIRIEMDDNSTRLAAIASKTVNLPANPAAAGDCQTGAAAALEAYDPPTLTELAAAVAAIRGADSDTLKTLSDQLDGVHSKTTNLPSSPAAVGSAMTLTSGERDAIAGALLDLADGVEDGETLRQALRLMRAVLLGRSNGFPGGPFSFRDRANAKNRVTVAADSDGNRSSITTDPS